MVTSTHGFSRFSIRLPRRLWIHLVAVMLIVAGVGLCVGLPTYRQKAPARGAKHRPSLLQLIGVQVPVRSQLAGDQHPNAGIFTIAAATLSIAVVALAVWFSVRLVNCRRKPGARHWAVGVLAILSAYPLAFGPACWINERTNADTRIISVVFYPIIRLANQSSRVAAIALRFAGLGASEGSTPSFEGDEISWWREIGDPGKMLPYRVVISCTFSPESEDFSGEALSDEIENETDETE